MDQAENVYFKPGMEVVIREPGHFDELPERAIILANRLDYDGTLYHLMLSKRDGKPYRQEVPDDWLWDWTWLP